MEEAKSNYISYLKNEKIIITWTKKKNGVMIYDTKQVKDLQRLTKLAEGCDLALTVFGGNFNTQTGVKNPVVYYIGAPNTDNQADYDEYLAKI